MRKDLLGAANKLEFATNIIRLQIMRSDTACGIGIKTLARAEAFRLDLVVVCQLDRVEVPLSALEAECQSDPEGGCRLVQAAVFPLGLVVVFQSGREEVYQLVQEVAYQKDPVGGYR